MPAASALRAGVPPARRPAGTRDGTAMAVTLCVSRRAPANCARRSLPGASTDSMVMELTARHRITGVEWDARERAVAMVVEITDPQTARPVDVRIDIIDPGRIRRGLSSREANTIGHVVRDGRARTTSSAPTSASSPTKTDQPNPASEPMWLHEGRTAAIVGVLQHPTGPPPRRRDIASARRRGSTRRARRRRV